MDGKPRIIHPQLPDSFSQLDLGRLYELCLKEGVPDVECFSSLRLRGATETLALHVGISLFPNYAAAWSACSHAWPIYMTGANGSVRGKKEFEPSSLAAESEPLLGPHLEDY